MAPASPSNSPLTSWLMASAVATLGMIVAAAPPQKELFIRPTPPLPIYHTGWIDLNKNGLKDPYEDQALDVETRLDDLLARMTLEEKTAQMATLYGFPRVLNGLSAAEGPR